MIERNLTSPLKSLEFETSSKSDNVQNAATRELQPICHEILPRNRSSFNLLLNLANKKTSGKVAPGKVPTCSKVPIIST